MIGTPMVYKILVNLSKVSNSLLNDAFVVRFIVYQLKSFQDIYNPKLHILEPPLGPDCF